MSRKRKPHPYNGRTVLCDYDPEIGYLMGWRSNSGVARIRFFGKHFVVKRDARCIFFRGNGTRVHEFERGYLLCKVREWEITGHSGNDRRGSLFTATWYRTYATGYQERHTGGEAHTEIYAIIIGDALVHRPKEYLEITVKLPQTAGPVADDLLCTVKAA